MDGSASAPALAWPPSDAAPFADWLLLGGGALLRGGGFLGGIFYRTGHMNSVLSVCMTVKKFKLPCEARVMPKLAPQPKEEIRE